ncbi:flagellar biosynthetic protein FliO [Sansalvadorimonas verongulae]|uniref:flagellar biosynthetic protein FliO n=1 Tax=Sansalvadorimonas verongulae TaxID=2172824 RepID=UPI0012BD3178|nr:flagellar biosynthetic protein FliO [Sansalvadorimonas verongulae]MTI13796.1 flagellar biosynthetic protein FliO [Sansalvadorimonas verongulae]
MSRLIKPRLLKSLLFSFLIIGSSLVFGEGSEAVFPIVSESTAPIVPEAVSADTDNELGMMELVKMMFTFLFVICLMFGLAWWVRRWRPDLAPGQIGLKTRAVLSLGGRDRVVVVQAGERQLLLGVSSGRITLLGDYDKLLPEPEIRSDSAQTFRDLLKRS